MNLLRTEGRLRIENFHPWVAFEIACMVEKEGGKFYENLAGKIDDPGLRNIVLELQKAEEIHYKRFKTFQDMLTVSAPVDADLYQMINYGLFEGRFQYVQITNVVELLKFGIYIEEKSIELYTFYQTMISDANTKQALEQITSDERKHKEELTVLLTKYEKRV